MDDRSRHLSMFSVRAMTIGVTVVVAMALGRRQIRKVGDLLGLFAYATVIGHTAPEASMILSTLRLSPESADVTWGLPTRTTPVGGHSLAAAGLPATNTTLPA